MKCSRPKIDALFLALGFFRLVGSFPYRRQNTSRGEFQLKGSCLAALWSALFILAITGSSLYSIVIADYSDHRSTKEVLQYILKTCWYTMVIIFFSYLAICSRLLVKILRGMVDAGVNLRRRIVDATDVPVGICLLVAILGLCWYLKKLESGSIQKRISRATDSIADFTIMIFLSVLYLLVKILGLEMEDTVRSLKKEGPRPWTIISGRGHRNKTDNEAFQSPFQGLQTPSLSPSQQMLQLDDVMGQLVSYLGPPFALLLLNNISATTVFLYNSIVTHDIFYTFYVIVPISRMLYLALVPDPLLRKRETCKRLLCQMKVCGDYVCPAREMKKMEQVVRSGVPFTICGFFSLGRHTVLTVWSFVATYLVITLQFQASEHPADEKLCNCTLSG